MKERDIFVYGAGGAGRELADNLSYSPFWNVLGFIDDDTKKIGTIIDGLEVLGGLDWLRNYEGNLAFCMVGEPAKKKAMIARIKENCPGIRFPLIINEKSQVSKYVTFGEGCIVAQPFNHLVPGVSLGNYVWINSYCGIGHDVQIGDYSTLYSNINLGGAAEIGERCLIGSGVTVRPGVIIGDDVIVGGGAVVVKDVPNGVTVIGNPAKELQIKKS